MKHTMTKPHILLALMFCLGAVFSLCWGIPRSLERTAISTAPTRPGALFTAGRDHTAAYPENLLCGPKSLAGAAARLGLWIEPKVLAARCQIRPQGISMLDLQQAAPLFGLEARGLMLSWKQLTALDRPAVLYLTPNHFVFVDPRERPPAGLAHQLRLYDSPNPARWVTRGELLKQWRGETLVISRDGVAHPALDFETLLEDFGSAYSQDAPACTFRFRNTGRSVIRILDVKKSCGCTKAELSQAELKPGEEARLAVSIDLKGRKGMQRQVVFLRTSEPAQPVIPLTLQGTALSPVHISTEAIDLGRVVPGQQVACDFIVTDRNIGLLALTTSTFTAAETVDHGQTAALAVKASWQPTDRSVDEQLNASPAQPDWVTIIRGQGRAHYLVKVTARIAPSASPGMHQGKLTLATNDPHNPTITMPLVCLVASENQLAPERISLGVIRPDQGVKRTILLQDLGVEGWGEAASELKTVSETGEALRPRVVLRREAGKTVAIELLLDPHGASAPYRAGLHQGTVTLQGPRGTLTLPWMYFAKQI